MARCLDVSLAVVAMLVSASAAVSQDARARANALENDAANGVKTIRGNLGTA
jgi:type IV secretory pathway VirB2 component (pilin)